MAIINGTVNNYASIANSGYLTIQATSGEEWVIFNIYAPVGSATELYMTNGSNDIKIDSDNTGGWRSFKYLITNTQYLKIKNVSGGAIYIGYDGIRRI